MIDWKPKIRRSVSFGPLRLTFKVWVNDYGTHKVWNISLPEIRYRRRSEK